tara:strand:- start:225 stop:701 length:477 start_codon:yes stop_codon:yes gene_type:complete
MDGHYQFNKRFNFSHNIFCFFLYSSYYSRIYYIIFSYTGLFNIYSKEDRRSFMSKETIKEIIEMMDAKINHIEDITADNRALIVKLVKQSNQIVKFLRTLELEITQEEQIFQSPSEEKIYKLMDLVKEYKESNKEFKKFMEELEEFKEDITPGQFGES